MLVAILSYFPVAPFLICRHTGNFWEEPDKKPASLLFFKHAFDENKQWASPQMAVWMHFLVENCHHAVLAGGDWSNNTGSRSSQTRARHDQQRWTALLAKCLGLTACPGKEKTLRERKQNRPKITVSGRGLQRLPHMRWRLLAHVFGPRVFGGTWGSESPFHHWLCPFQQSMTTSYRFLLALEMVHWPWTRGSLRHLGWE